MKKYQRNLEVDFLHNLVCPEFPLSETPFISSLDAEDEYLTIYNPSSAEISLAGYFLSDSKKLHRFVFPEDVVVLPRSQLHVYTCPGHQSGDFIEPYALWTNSDGSLRRKEVLNNEYCVMQLHAPNGKCLAICTGGGEGPPRIQRRSEELHDLPPWQLSPSQRVVCGALRLVFLAALLSTALLAPSYVAVCYWLAVSLDVLGRSHVEEIDLPYAVEVVDRLGDRVHISILYLMSLMAVVHPWRPVLYIVLLLCGGLELISWALEDLAPPFFSSRRDGRKGLKDLFQIIRQRCGGDDGSDFHKMGNLIIALICLGSEVALLLLYYRFTLSLPVQGEPGERLFHLIQVVVIPIASLAFALRQGNNVMRIACRLDLEWWAN